MPLPSSHILKLKTVSILGQSIDIVAVQDNHPLVEKAYRLWYQVYVQELQYPINEGRNDATQQLCLAPVGSIVFLALKGEECVATLRAAFAAFSPLDFDYAEFLAHNRVGELSKLIAHRSYRKTAIIAHILIACSEYNALTGKEDLYETIVMAAVPKLLPYYTTFGFRKASKKLVYFPDLQLDGYVLACDKRTNQRVVAQLQKIVAGDWWVKLKWAARYWCAKHLKM